MHSRRIVLAVGLLAAPLSLLTMPDAGSTGPRAVTLVAAPFDSTLDGRVLQPAPVPNIDPPGVAPVDRVAGAGSRTLDAGPVNSTPFSATPTGTLSSGASQPSVRDRVGSPADATEATPNLGR